MLSLRVPGKSHKDRNVPDIHNIRKIYWPHSAH
jgi:hypothetical protein